MEIAAQTVVSIRFKMKNQKGEILENSLEGPPIDYLHGNGSILPLLETELNGLSVGDHKTIFISKDQGYGEIDDAFTIEVVVDGIRPATETELKENRIEGHSSTNSCEAGCQCQ